MRNTLYLQLLRCIQTVRPRVFLAENVRGILNLDNGAALTEILEGFHNAGYLTTFHVANAADYGVPQNRWRVFFVGIRMDLAGTFVPPSPTHSNPAKLKSDGQLLPSDVVIGGFPCQGFSVANTRRHVDDERNVLYLQMLDVIQHVRPLYAVAENVKGPACNSKTGRIDRCTR